MARKSYQDRLDSCENPLLRKLFKIMIEKQSNLCVATDFTTLKEALDLIDRIGKHVCVIKVHCEDFTDEYLDVSLEKLYAKKKEHNFLLFEDRKFSEVPEQFKAQYAGKYVKYADLVTMWPLCDGSFKAIRSAIEDAKLPDDEPRGCLAVVELSIADEKHVTFNTSSCLKLAARHPQVCVGIIAQGLPILDDCQMIKATPGVHLEKTASDGGQRWKTPDHVIKQGTDMVIVGRGIISSPKDELESVACRYKEASWQAYLDDLNSAETTKGTWLNRIYKFLFSRKAVNA